MWKKKQQYKVAYLNILIQRINLRLKKKIGINTNSKKKSFLFSLSLCNIKKKKNISDKYTLLNSIIMHKDSFFVLV